eukprot:TRINITY_DN11927_c0_g1_i1.p1 TRINITY_DN11927_c0_g1~~TRINITY_DN11927_c0_g1_i1.p1  ORF type:complete len:335 (-),score=50.01 TRINITY_DN11927_c0_g1_i1:45-1049(-)
MHAFRSLGQKTSISFYVSRGASVSRLFAVGFPQTFSKKVSPVTFSKKVSPFLHFQTRSITRRTRRTMTETEQKALAEQEEEQKAAAKGGLFGWGKDTVQSEDVTEEITGRQADAITPAVQRHLIRVYSLLGATSLASAVGVGLSLTVLPVTAPVFFTALVFQIGGIVAISFTNPERTTLRTSLLVAIGLTSGMTLAPLIAMAIAVNPVIIMNAALGTLGIFAGFTATALLSKRRGLLMLGGPLLGGVIAVLVLGLLTMILPYFGIASPQVLSALYNIYLWLGLGVFSLFIAYDTQRMIESARAGLMDHVSDALGMFLNVLNVFIFLLRIFMPRD